jgi:hypothetical protein
LGGILVLQFVLLPILRQHAYVHYLMGQSSRQAQIFRDGLRLRQRSKLGNVLEAGYKA